MPPKNSRTLIVFALVAVYFIWGSTYLALRFGLEGFPPFVLNGVRFVVAGVGMYVVLRFRGHPAPTRRQWWNAGRMGSLLLIGGVGLVTIAEDYGVGSGVVATAAAAIPVWAALASGIFGQWPVGREWAGLGVGLLGVVVLLGEGDFRISAAGMALVIAGPMFWAFGSVWGKLLEMPKGLMAPAAQLLVAGVLMLVASPIMGERITEVPGAVAWFALAYLIVMGSIVAYTAYVYLLETVRPVLATSYAYVNPAVAVFLGLTLGAELITGPIFVALPLILAGVALIATASRTAERSDTRTTAKLSETLKEAA